MSSWKENPFTKADSDEALIVNVGQGDIRAFETLVSRYQKSALRAARRFGFDQQETEDLAQEAFLTVFRKAARYEPKALFKTWFFTILLNLCRNAIKKKKPVYFDTPPMEVIEHAGSEDPTARLDRQQLQQALANAIAKLPENQRAAFILCHYENFSYAEAAGTIGVSIKAVESLLVRAKRHLRAELAWLKDR